MSLYSKMRFYCNACGVEMIVVASRVIGRNWKVCSSECLKEMQWRETLSIMGKPYEPQQETK